MNEQAKPFYEINKYIPKNNTCCMWCPCVDDTIVFITRDNAGEYHLYHLNKGKAKHMRQSNDPKKLIDLVHKVEKK